MQWKLWLASAKQAVAGAPFRQNFSRRRSADMMQIQTRILRRERTIRRVAVGRPYSWPSAGINLHAIPGTRLLKLWRLLKPWPGGQWLFARIFAWLVPYSGSVRPRVRVFEPGHAQVEIPDRRSNRQHLGSVHAIALINVAEQASGLAMLAGLPDGMRGIVTQISMQYLKKARGTIRAVSTVVVPPVTADTDIDVTADCLDPSGAVVARATVRWRVGPVRA